MTALDRDKRESETNDGADRPVPAGGDAAGEDRLSYLLTAYLFDNISDEGRREVEEQLASDPQTAAEHEAFRKTLSLLEDALDSTGESYSFDERRRERVLAAARERRSRIVQFLLHDHPRLTRGVAAAMVLVVCLAGLMTFVGKMYNASRSGIDTQAGTELSYSVDHLERARGSAENYGYWPDAERAIQTMPAPEESASVPEGEGRGGVRSYRAPPELASAHEGSSRSSAGAGGGDVYRGESGTFARREPSTSPETVTASSSAPRGAAKEPAKRESNRELAAAAADPTAGSAPAETGVAAAPGTPPPPAAEPLAMAPGRPGGKVQNERTQPQRGASLADGRVQVIGGSDEAGTSELEVTELFAQPRDMGRKAAEPTVRRGESISGGTRRHDTLRETPPSAVPQQGSADAAKPGSGGVGGSVVVLEDSPENTTRTARHAWERDSRAGGPDGVDGYFDDRLVIKGGETSVFKPGDDPGSPSGATIVADANRNEARNQSVAEKKTPPRSSSRRRAGEPTVQRKADVVEMDIPKGTNLDNLTNAELLGDSVNDAIGVGGGRAGAYGERWGSGSVIPEGGVAPGPGAIEDLALGDRPRLGVDFDSDALADDRNSIVNGVSPKNFFHKPMEKYRAEGLEKVVDSQEGKRNALTANEDGENLGLSFRQKELREMRRVLEAESESLPQLEGELGASRPADAADRADTGLAAGEAQSKESAVEQLKQRAVELARQRLEGELPLDANGESLGRSRTRETTQFRALEESEESAESTTTFLGVLGQWYDEKDENVDARQLASALRRNRDRDRQAQQAQGQQAAQGLPPDDASIVPGQDRFAGRLTELVDGLEAETRTGPPLPPALEESEDVSRLHTDWGMFLEPREDLEEDIEKGRRTPGMLGEVITATGGAQSGEKASPLALENVLTAYMQYRDNDPDLELVTFLRNPRPAPPPEIGDEGLGREAFRERYGTNPFVDTRRDRLSTFAMDVDTASFTRARQLLRQDTLPPAEAVRVEEFVNAVPVDYPTDPDEVFSVFSDGMPSPFGVGNTELLRVGIKARELAEGERRAAVLTLAVDVSGSMAENSHLGLIQDALAVLIERLEPTDQVALVAYSEQANLILPHTPARDRERILGAIHSLAPRGGTNVEAGLDLAYRIAHDALSPRSLHRVILVSDGVANVGARGPEKILERVRVFARRGIYLTAVGVGSTKYDDHMLERLANEGNGNYAYVSSVEEAATIFERNLPSTLEVLAQDAKIQVEFDADTVSHYRLLGYENRDIRDEDFRNDKVDAGEVGPGTTVTALYEIVRRRGADGPLGKVFIRYRDTRSLRVVERDFPMPQGILVSSPRRAGWELRFLACVAELAELLRDSYYARDGSFGALLSELRRIPPPPEREAIWADVYDMAQRARALRVRQWLAEARD